MILDRMLHTLWNFRSSVGKFLMPSWIVYWCWNRCISGNIISGREEAEECILTNCLSNKVLIQHAIPATLVFLFFSKNMSEKVLLFSLRIFCKATEYPSKLEAASGGRMHFIDNSFYFFLSTVFRTF